MKSLSQAAPQVNAESQDIHDATYGCCDDTIDAAISGVVSVAVDRDVCHIFYRAVGPAMYYATTGPLDQPILGFDLAVMR